MEQTFNRLFNFWRSEPVVATAIVVGALDLLTVFGLPISVEQKTAVVTFVTAVGVAVARSQVSPVGKS